MLTTQKLVPILFLTTAAVANIAESGSTNRYGRMAESMIDMMDSFSSAYQKKRQGDSSSGQMPWSSSGTPSAGSWMPGSSMMSPWSMGSMPMTQSMNPWSMGSMPMTQGMNPWSMGSMPMTQNMNPWNMGNIPWSQGGKMMPWDQWSGPGSSRGDGESQARQERYSPAPPGKYGVIGLGGNWQGPSGEILMIRNDRFRIYLDRERFKEGTLTVLSTDRLLMLDPETGIEREYEYAMHEGKLALRDQAGNLLLFKRAESQFNR